MWSVVPTTTATQRHAVLTALVAGAGATAVWCNPNSTTTSFLETANKKQVTKPNHKDEEESNPIEVNLMDKIAHKVYLNPSRARLQAGSSSVEPVVTERPLGVPTHLRILAIDMPEMRQRAFSNGDCRVAFDKVYPDGVAPPKPVFIRGGESNEHDKKKNNNKKKLDVPQKVWVKSMIRCLQKDTPKVGVEMMEASFADLNPQNLRATRQLGEYHYDPGKYTHHKPMATSSSSTTSNDTDAPTEIAVTTMQEADELDAPWNQYAFIEEVTLRIHGYIPFGAPLEPSSRWGRFLTGNHYKPTVPSQLSFWQWPLPSFLQSDPQGLDGGGTKVRNNKENSNNNPHNNWASQKPHAVIANGAAVQRVPSGLRLLQKTCQDANVPLFVLHDPRAWGGNTHENLQQALRDVRFIVKQNIILAAMEEQSGFSRGKLVGRMERQIEVWGEQSRVDRQRRQETLRRRQWHKLDAVSLEKRLVEHGVIRREDRVEDGKVHRRYTPAMMEIARQCVADMEEENGTVSNNDQQQQEQNN